MRNCVRHVGLDMKMMMKLCKQDGLGVTWIVVVGIILRVLALQENPGQQPNLFVSSANDYC